MLKNVDHFSSQIALRLERKRRRAQSRCYDQDMMRFLLAVLIFVSATAASACVAPFAIGERQVSYLDASRGNRSVSVLLRFPKATISASGPLVGCGFPAVVVAHGFTIPGNRYAWLSNALVPLGYVLLFPRTEEGIADHLTFARDLEFVLQALQNDPAFAGVLGPASALIGHSMGGGASVLAAASAPQIDALIGLAPAQTNPSAISAAANVLVPTLILSASLDCVTPFAQHAGPIFAALGTPQAQRRLVSIAGGSHCQFSDGYFTCSIGEGSCTPPSLSAAQQHAASAAQIAPFLRNYLLDGLIFLDRFEE